MDNCNRQRFILCGKDSQRLQSSLLENEPLQLNQRIVSLNQTAKDYGNLE